MKIYRISEDITPKQQKTLQLIDYPEWLSREILRLTDNYTRPIDLALNIKEDDFKRIAVWASETKPDLSNKTLEEIAEPAIKWAMDREESDMAKEYKGSKVVYEFKDGWKVVDMPKDKKTLSKNIEIERNILGNGKDEDTDAANYATYNSGFTAFGDLTDVSKESNVLFFSLRDPNNIPHDLIEMIFEEKNPKKVWVREVFSKEIINSDNGEWINPQKNRIKEFIQALKAMGYELGVSPEATHHDKMTAEKLPKVPKEDQFGITYGFYGIGGDANTYRENFNEAEAAGYDRNDGFYMGYAKEIIDSLIQYAIDHNEINLLEDGLEMYENGYVTDKVTDKGYKIMDYGLMGRIEEYMSENLYSMGIESISEDEAPNPEDYMTKPDPNQLSLPNVPPPQPILDKEAYDEAMKEYSDKMKKYKEARSELEENSDIIKFSQYIYDAIQKAKQSQGKKTKTKKVSKKAGQMTKIIKLSESVEERKLDGEALALQVKVLKMHLKDNPKLDKSLADLIMRMPSPRQIRQDFSAKECDVLYETVAYLWKKMTGKNLVPEKDIQKAPETLQGNYWILPKGILLHGVNHYSIAKHNENLICSLLDIGGWTFQEYLSECPNRLIWLLIKHGGVRMFISKDRRLYTQMSSEAYSKFGKSKVKKYDFKYKIAKIIDLRAPYNGWKSGIPIKM